MPDFYNVLGVPRNASEKDVRNAYRKMAREYHPDVNRGNKSSEDKFKQINEAYSVLSDPDKRRRYNKYGDNWARSEQIEEAEARNPSGGAFRWFTYEGGEPSFDFGERRGNPFDRLFTDLGHDVRRSPPAEHPVEVTLEEAFQGTSRRVELLYGRRLDVKIPPGVDNGSRVRVAAGEGQRGTIYLVVSVKPHPNFQRKGGDLYTDVEVPMEDAILGGQTTVTTLSGKVSLTIPADTQNGQRFRLAGQGMPALNKSKVRGNLYATAKVKLPTDLTPEQRDWFRRLKDTNAGDGG